VVLMGSQALSYRDSFTLLRESRRDKARLQERTDMLNQVIDHAPQGVARVGLDLRITNVNPSLASQLHATETALIGAALSEFVPAGEVARVFALLAADGARRTETVEADSLAHRADGSQFWMRWSATAVRGPDGAISFYLAMFEDVTAKHEAEETAMANLAQLEKLNRLKSEFVSMVSHEFRTALVGIQGFSELMQGETLGPDDVKGFAADIFKDAERLNRMITEMLDLDRMEAGKIRLELRQVDLNALIADAVERARLTSEKSPITVALQASLQPVSGDADRLTQVITNLLSNAIKYSTEGGEIAVTTRCEGGFAQVTVADHGRGIPPEFIHRLFGRYERFEDKHAGKIIGTGLGLAITRQIVEMHGGRIWVESGLGKGSTFGFTVPLAPAVNRATHI
jgi:PAS domain S-box-containing protein